MVRESGATGASGRGGVIGNVGRSAGIGLRQTLQANGTLKESYTPGEFVDACRRHVAEKGVLRSLARYSAPEGIYWDDVKYKGEAYSAYAWAVYVAEVSVDLTTYAAEVEDFVALQEIGKVLHPVLAKGQIIGGVAQAIGFSLYEKVLWQDGRILNGPRNNYIIPASFAFAPCRVIFQGI